MQEYEQLCRSACFIVQVEPHWRLRMSIKCFYLRKIFKASVILSEDFDVAFGVCDAFATSAHTDEWISGLHNMIQMRLHHTQNCACSQMHCKLQSSQHKLTCQHQLSSLQSSAMILHALCGQPRQGVRQGRRRRNTKEQGEKKKEKGVQYKHWDVRWHIAFIMTVVSGLTGHVGYLLVTLFFVSGMTISW